MPQPDVAKKMLETFKTYADKHKVKFFLLFGTCLGAVRDKDFIDDDVDVDIGVYADDPNLKNMLNDMMSHHDHNYYEQKGKIMRCEILMYYSLDINPLHKIGDKYYYLKKFQDGKMYGKEYPEKFFDTLEEIDFKGMKVKVPAYPKEYLTYLYNGWERKAPKGTSNLRELVCVNIK